MDFVDPKRCGKYALFAMLAIGLPIASGKAQESGSSSPPVSNVPINRPTLIGDPATWFGPDAYPAEAIRSREEGRVVARLSIDARGRAVGCSIETSSNSVVLDTTTCAIAIEHLVFKPAWNTRGDPVPSEFLLPVRWTMPQSVPVPRVSFSAVSRAEISSSGAVLNCVKKVEGNDPNEAAGDDCAELRDDPDARGFLLEPVSGRHALLWIQTALIFDGDKPFPDDFRKPGRFAVSFTRVRFRIAASGAIQGCEKVAEAGPMAEVDMCDDFIRRFTPETGRARRGATLLYAVSAEFLDEPPPSRDRSDYTA